MPGGNSGRPAIPADDTNPPDKLALSPNGPGRPVGVTVKPSEGSTMYGKILVPVDGSETSTRGLTEAIKIAKAQGSQLRLVNIVNEYILDITYAPGLFAENLIESLVKAGRKVLDSAEKAARRREGGERADRIHRRRGCRPDPRASETVAGGSHCHGNARTTWACPARHGQRCRTSGARRHGAGDAGSRCGAAGQGDARGEAGGGLRRLIARLP